MKQVLDGAFSMDNHRVVTQSKPSRALTMKLQKSLAKQKLDEIALL